MDANLRDLQGIIDRSPREVKKLLNSFRQSGPPTPAKIVAAHKRYGKAFLVNLARIAETYKYAGASKYAGEKKGFSLSGLGDLLDKVGDTLGSVDNLFGKKEAAAPAPGAEPTTKTPSLIDKVDESINPPPPKPEEEGMDTKKLLLWGIGGLVALFVIVMIIKKL